MVGRTHIEAIDVTAWLNVGPESVITCLRKLTVAAAMNRDSPSYYYFMDEALDQVSSSDCWT
jgi:hypothetical protein